MGMTAKEIVRIAWERDLEVTLLCIDGTTWTGHIQSPAIGSTNNFQLKHLGKHRSYSYDFIKTIRFVDEPEDIKNPDEEHDELFTLPRRNVRQGVFVIQEDYDKREQELSELRQTITELRARLTVLESGSEPAERKQCKIFDCSSYTDCCYIPYMNCSKYEPIDDTEDEHDIAKERWGWRPVGTGEGLVRLDELSYLDSPSQKKLQAAAPELADKARALLRGVDHSKRPGENIYPDGYHEMFELLDKLGIKELRTPGAS